MEKRLEKIKSQMRKGVMEYTILLILRHRKAYSADLLDILKENDLIVVEGTIYPLLVRMKNEGLIEYTWMESTLGPPRKYYFITELGLEYLDKLRVIWTDMRDSVDSLDVENPSWKEAATREGIRLTDEPTVVKIAETENMSLDETDDAPDTDSSEASDDQGTSDETLLEQKNKNSEA